MQSQTYVPVFETPEYFYLGGNTSIETLDLGGQGDCLVRVFNQFLTSLKSDPIDTEDLYKQFGLEPFSFLEDCHLAGICSTLGINAFVVSIVENSYICCFYDFGSDKTLSIMNYNPLHFTLIESILVDGLPFEIFEHLGNVEPMPETSITIDGVTKIFIPLGKTHSEDLLPDVREIVKLQPSVLIPTDDIRIIYSYLLDVNIMDFHSVAEVMDCFYQGHHIILDFLSSMNNSSLTPPSAFFKAYYKFRHNVFSFLCLQLLGANPNLLDTDVPLTKWIPGSKKTPDFVTETDDSITIWEFTVGNRYETVDHYKGGGIYDLKYTNECSLISKNTGKISIVKIVPCVLDHYNIDEILSLLSLENLVQHRNLLLDYMNICNLGKDSIAFSYANSRLYTHTFSEPNLYLDLPYNRPDLPKIALFEAEFLSKLLVNNTALLSRAQMIGNRTAAKQSLCYDIQQTKFFFREMKIGMSAHDWVDALRKNDVGELVSNIQFFSNGSSVDRSKVKGTVPVSIPKKPKVFKNYQWATESFVSKVYDSKMATFDPGYGEPIHIEIGDCSHRFFDDKVAFPPDYMSKLCTMDLDSMLSFKGQSMLANCHVNASNIDSAVSDFADSWSNINSQITAFRPKQTFMVPFATHPLEKAPLDVLPSDIMNFYITHGKGGLTKAVIHKALNGEFVPPNDTPFNEKVQKAKSAYKDACVFFYDQMREVAGPGHHKWAHLTREQKDTLTPSQKKMSETLRSYKNSLSGGKAKISPRMVRLNVKKGSVLQNEKLKEFEHFGNRGMYGVGETDDRVAGELEKYFSSLTSRMFEPDFHKMDYPALYSSHRSPGPEFLTNMKNNYTERWDIFTDKFFRGTLCQQLVFLARNLANFLFNESTKNHNSSFFKVDNLGFSDLLVICAGGSKIYKNQTSKLFRVMFYMDNRDKNYSGYAENPTFELFEKGDKTLVCTPWCQMRQDILFDYISLPYTTFNSLYSVYTRVYTDFTQPIPSLMCLPLLLSLHNRRKTESFMHNCRYLVVNLLGENANLEGIIKSFATFNYTYLDTWLKHRISRGYREFSTRMMALSKAKRENIDALLDQNGIRDLWFSQPIGTADQLTLFIYTTYMMTKSPVNSSVEQSLNLWEVLADVRLFEELHPDVEGMNDKTLRCNVLDFQPEIYQDDFKYDPVYCQFQGHYLAGFLSNVTTRDALEVTWDRISTKDLDTIANSHGLRGYKESNFFNKKGYEVVYDYISEKVNPDDLVSLIDQYILMDPVTVATSIQSDKVNLIDTEGFQKLLFHIVHKIQRGGNREIYCMDLNTKRNQNPIEQFMKHICKLLPNEFISIPSSKRHSIIHNDFYERSIGSWVTTVKRWVLDCRRWAPHSIFQKYVHFIKGLSVILPAGFLEHFYKFADGMMNKKFVTREHVLSKMRNNERFKPYADMVPVANKIVGAYQFAVKFSFVMGIFNYMSTTLHAANQLLASEVIRMQCLRQGNGLVLMDPKCHSDDSVVTSYHEKPQSVRTTVMLYDWMLKCSNHMLSVKKSQINNNVYLEFLSVLYLFDRLLPVYPKFTSTMPFKPSDNGYSSDLGFCVTQGIELLSQGGTFEECFLLCKTTERFIQTSYAIDVAADLPPQLMGQFDSHPLELVYLGGMADLVRWYMYKNDDFWKVYNNLWDRGYMSREKGQLDFDWDMGASLQSGPLRQYERYFQKVDPELLNSWTVTNCKLGNGKLNLLWYYAKLKDRKFRSSLLDEPVARRYSRIQGASHYRQIKCNTQLVPAGTISVVLPVLNQREDSVIIDSGIQQTMEFMAGLIKDFYDTLEGATISDIVVSNIKEKPVLFIKESHPLSDIDISHTEYVSYTKDSKYYKLLGKRSNPSRQCKRITEYLKLNNVDPETLSADNLSVVVRRVLSRSETQLRFVSSTSSPNKIIKDMTNVVNLIKYNSYAHRKMNIVHHRATEIDWGRKSIMGKMPQSASDYLRNYWMCRLLVEYKIDQLDVFNVNPVEREKVLVESLSLDWKIILLSSLESEEIPLADLSYWCYWEKEQVRIGYKWFGHGVCILKTPEAVLRLVLDNGVLTKLDIESDYHGYFSNSTSWFLHNYLNFSGIHVDLILSDFCDPDDYYLGYSQSTQTYGYHRPNQFDYVVSRQSKAPLLLPGFTKVCLPRKRVGSHFLYGEDSQYYIDFFVPTSEPSQVSFKGVFDIEKIKANKANPDLRKFLHDLSIDFDEYLMIDKQDLIDNIADTKLYKLIYESDSFTDHMNSRDSNHTMVDGMMKWKKSHPQFGFPSEKDIDVLLGNENVPPFPKKVMEALLRLGKSNMPSIDYDRLLTVLATMSNDDRVSYMMNNFAYLSGDLRVNLLVMSMRSKRIYDSCKVMGPTVFKAFVPLMDAVASCLDNCPLSSRKLSRLVKSFNLGMGTNYRESDAFKFYACHMVVCSLFSEEVWSKEFKAQENLLTILEELWDDGLGGFLNKSTQTDQILRTIDFSVEKDVFLGWVVDLCDCLTDTNFKWRYKLKPNLPVKQLFGEGSLINNEISPLRGNLIRMKVNPTEQFLYYTVGLELRRLSRHTGEMIPGIVNSPFYPIDQDSQMELMSSIAGGDTEEDIGKYLEKDPDPSIPELAYLYCPVIREAEVRKLRGTAQSLFIHSFAISRDIKNVHGKKRFFMKVANDTSLIKRIQSETECILYIGANIRKMTIKGFRELSWEQFWSTVRVSKYVNDALVISGDEYTKQDLVESPWLRDMIEGIDSYFQRISSHGVKEDVEEIVKKSDLVMRDKYTSPGLKQKRDKLARLLETLEQKSERDNKPISFDDFNLIETLDEMLKSGNLETDSGNKEYVVATQRQYVYTEPARFLTDIEFKSELNALFPDYVNMLQNGEVRISAKTKQRIRSFMNSQIRSMQKPLKPKYKKLKVVVESALTMTQECQFRQNETLDFVSVVDDLFNIDLESEEEYDSSYDYLPGTGESLVQFDLEKLLG
jgi:hypothetical protein